MLPKLVKGSSIVCIMSVSCFMPNMQNSILMYWNVNASGRNRWLLTNGWIYISFNRSVNRFREETDAFNCRSNLPWLYYWNICFWRDFRTELNVALRYVAWIIAIGLYSIATSLRHSIATSLRLSIVTALRLVCWNSWKLILFFYSFPCKSCFACRGETIITAVTGAGVGLKHQLHTRELFLLLTAPAGHLASLSGLFTSLNSSKVSGFQLVINHTA